MRHCLHEDEIPLSWVRTYHGVRIVAGGLRHLLAILRQHEPIYDEILPGGLPEEGGGEDQERVEPAPGGKMDQNGAKIGRKFLSHTVYLLAKEI